MTLSSPPEADETPGPDRLHGAGRPGAAPAWHAEEVEAALSRLSARREGLSDAEARRRLQVHGANTLPAARPPHPLLRFLRQFHNILIYFLLVAAAGAWALGDVVDAAVIAAVVVINALVGFVQEGKAEKALDAIRNLIAPHASVRRNGARTTVPVVDIVPGDTVILEAGDRVPADLRLVAARGLRIEEALLTGESVPAEKQVAPVPAAAPPAERSSMAFAGTWVAAGHGEGVAVATGTRTEIGAIGELVAGVEQLTSPLLRQMNDFGRRFTLVAIGVAALVFAFAVLVRAFPWPEALLAVVALAVGAVPEGLPAVITIALAIGVQRMAARNAVVRRLPVVETLGSTSVICSDKTGTLTRNEMAARHVVLAGLRLVAEGEGYAPHGRLRAEDGAAQDAAVLHAQPLLHAALLCNDAQLRQVDGHWRVAGDPMEGALLALAARAGLGPAAVRAAWPRSDEIPFDATHRLMATAHVHGDSRRVFVKGAPERLLALCCAELGRDGAQPLDRAFWEREIAAAAHRGERVLAFACKDATGDQPLGLDGLGDALVFLGIVGLLDPPRSAARAAVAQCRAAGIRVQMITGDHAETAAAIARQLGLAQTPHVTSGAQVEILPQAALQEVAARTDVFARTSPEHKLRIVRALQERGAIVAMTGDGVNDAPALKQADVGIAMGGKGTEAAKEAAQMVLLDDDFSSIVAAVQEGRTVYDNIRKIVVWTLPADGGEVLTVIAAILLGVTLPLTATQILWINLVTTVALGLVLAFEPAEPGVMRRPPRPAHAPLLSGFLVWRIALVSMLFTLAGLGVFFGALAAGRELEAARTLVVNTIVGLELFYLFNVRFLHARSLGWRAALGTPAVLIGIGATVAAQAAFTYAPVMQGLFATRPMHVAEIALVIGIGLGFMLLLELEKALLRRLGWLEGS